MNLTQSAGVLAFGCAALCCFFAGHGRSWRLLAVIHAALMTEVLLGLRHRIHDDVNAVLRETQAYDGRGGWQWMVLTAVLVVGAALAGVVLHAGRREHSRFVLVAAIFSLGAVTLFAAEAVSLHRLDAVLYGRLSGVMLIGWAWLALCAGVSVCALLSRWRISSFYSGARRRNRR